MRFIGITGGVGAGKTEVIKYIKQHYKCEIYLADQVAHEVKRAGTDCYFQLVALLGAEVVGKDGEINKALMAEKIFGDDALLYKVNAIVHPAVKEYLMDKLLKAKSNPHLELFFVEAALLIEAGYGPLVDEMWYIYADIEVRKARLKSSRGYSEEKIQSIMESQLSEEEFRKACDFVIDNSGILTETYRQINKKLEAFTWQE